MIRVKGNKDGSVKEFIARLLLRTQFVQKGSKFFRGWIAGWLGIIFRRHGHGHLYSNLATRIFVDPTLFAEGQPEFQVFIRVVVNLGSAQLAIIVGIEGFSNFSRLFRAHG